MYLVLECLTYLLGVLILGGVIFGVTVLTMLAESGAQRLSKATRKMTAQARLLAAEKLTPDRLSRQSPET